MHKQSLESAICEECYRLNYYGDDFYTKRYKHCILSEAITPPISRKICRCHTVLHSDPSGEPRSLFPIEKSEFPIEKNKDHFDYNLTTNVRCNILKMDGLVALSKYHGLQAMVKPEKRRSSKVSNASLAGSQYGTRTKESYPTGIARTDGDIPLFFRRYTEEYPFGNVHMALRVGPLVIENGVSQ